MNEREVVSRVLDMVDAAAYHSAARRVTRVRLEIGGKRPLDPVLLSRDFAACARGTVAEDAELLVSVLPVRHHCHNCGAEFQANAEEHACRQCGFFRTEELGGDEARVVEIEVEKVG